jgi:hypothetical protein
VATQTSANAMTVALTKRGMGLPRRDNATAAGLLS